MLSLTRLASFVVLSTFAACASLPGIPGFSSSRSAPPSTASATRDSAEPADVDRPPAELDEPVASAGPSAPAPGAWPSWRMSKGKITEDCTVKGSLSKPCFELHVKDEDAQARKGPALDDLEKEALRCMLIGVRNVAFPTGYPDTSSAMKVIELGGDSTAAGRECVRIATLASPDGKFKKDAAAAKERAEWLKKMSEVVKSTFKKKCGVEAALDGPSFATLTMERLNQSNKRVFYSGRDGTGNQVTVLCGGEITTHNASGGSMKMVARTWADDAKAMDEVGCLQRCANKNLTCLANGKNITIPACRQACLPSCQ